MNPQNTRTADQLKAELIIKFPFTNKDYIDEYVSMCVDYSTHQTESILSAIEKIRNSLIKQAEIADNTECDTDYKKGFYGGFSSTNERTSELLDELINKFKTK